MFDSVCRCFTFPQLSGTFFFLVTSATACTERAKRKPGSNFDDTEHELSDIAKKRKMLRSLPQGSQKRPWHPTVVETFSKKGERVQQKGQEGRTFRWRSRGGKSSLKPKARSDKPVTSTHIRA
ncbi:hypothetical protein BT96DRAFT_1009793 [Gymnopus androsaceus JB14]|uniref:Secreted protein n=1 Tax=Gymnopus androsaceus JB14 TaxID=1447944 RepID=A0A6A4GC40_9AGAR|nr:hypothetical protein BT96DRAFT_1009793 [Gymnopus androsaceus JB14]